MDNNALWYVDGHWVQPHDAKISLNDVAVLRGYSVFEALRTYDRRPFHLQEHLQRLFRSADLIDLAIPFTDEQIAEVIQETIARNPYQHAAIRILEPGARAKTVLCRAVIRRWPF